MNKKIVHITFILILILLLTYLTASTFAIWDKLTKSNNEIIEIGTGTILTKQVKIDGRNGKLVPKTCVLGPEDVHEVIFQYELKLSKETVKDLDLDVKIVNVKIGGRESLGKYVIIETFGINNNELVFQEQFVVNKNGTTVVLKICILEVDDQQIYELIKNQQITFDVVFTAYEKN